MKRLLVELKTGQLRVAYEYYDMSLLYADIAGFTAYAATVDAEDVMRIFLFKTFIINHIPNLFFFFLNFF